VYLIAGVNYIPVNTSLTFTPSRLTWMIPVMTIDNDDFEDDKRICFNITSVTEPCPGYVTVGEPLMLTILEDEGMFYVYCIVVFLNQVHI